MLHSTDLSWISSWACGSLVGQGRATWVQMPSAELNGLSSMWSHWAASQPTGWPMVAQWWSCWGEAWGWFKDKSRNGQTFWVFRLGTNMQLLQLLSTSHMKLRGHLGLEVWRSRFLFFSKRVVQSVEKGHTYRWGNSCAYLQPIY